MPASVAFLAPRSERLSCIETVFPVSGPYWVCLVTGLQDVGWEEKVLDPWTTISMLSADSTGSVRRDVSGTSEYDGPL